MSNLDKYNRYPDPPERGRRAVPMMTQLAVTFGGFFLQFGALFFAFGMIFWWVFGAQSDVTSWYKFTGALATAGGTAIGSHDTGISEGGSDSTPGTPIYRIDYSFTAPSGAHLTDSCYATGLQYTSGQPVSVEYLPDDPATSRIIGTRKSALGAWGIFVAIFPGLGLVFMVVGLRGNLRALRILKVGKWARGKLVNKQATGTKINNNIVYKFTFEYEDESGQAHQITDKTHHTHLLEDEEMERLIYNPAKPSEGMLVDVLPGKPEVLEDGSIASINPGVALLRVVLPVGGVAAHAAVGLFYYVL